MKSRTMIVATAMLAITISSGWTFLKTTSTATSMTEAAETFLGSLTAEQKEKAFFAKYAAPERVGWHFIPKAERKGLQIKEMTEPQRKAAHALLRSTLSQVGYDKATQIMQLEQILHELEEAKGTRRFARDPQRYYFTIFGTPGPTERWGLSIEGHHLSLNFVVADGSVISSTPTFFATNPAIVMNQVKGGAKKGTRVLDEEETLGFELVNSLNDEQAKTAIIAEKAPREIRGAGEPQPPTDAAVGIKYGDLTQPQQAIMRKLVHSYFEKLPEDVAKETLDAIIAAGPNDVRFAWAGAKKPGIGHYYRIQGSSFLIEFVNTQPDPAGNPANHIHCVWRNMKGDFALPIK
jgi:hypothetical protein